MTNLYTSNLTGRACYAVGTRRRTLVDEGASDFAIVDAKGRKVGYRWTIHAVACIPMTKEEHAAALCTWHVPVEIGLNHFELHTTPTRDGKGYGPAFNTARVATIDEARKVIAKRIAQACKRDTKKFRKEVAA